MGTENKLAVLNLAAASLETDEIYLEIGAFRGTSIVAASLDVDRGGFFTVDNFSQFGGPEVECRALIAKYGAGRIELIDRDAWELLRDPPFDTKVGVFFYDGPHEYWHQWKALEMVQPLLADEALVIVDDASWTHVAAANDAFLDTHPQFERLRRFESDGLNGERWWNGVDVITFRRARGQSHRGGVRVRYYRDLVVFGWAARQRERLAFAARRFLRGTRHPYVTMRRVIERR